MLVTVINVARDGHNPLMVKLASTCEFSACAGFSHFRSGVVASRRLESDGIGKTMPIQSPGSRDQVEPQNVVAAGDCNTKSETRDRMRLSMQVFDSAWSITASDGSVTP